MAATTWALWGIATYTDGLSLLRIDAFAVGGSPIATSITTTIDPVSGSVSDLANAANSNAVTWSSQAVTAPGFAIHITTPDGATLGSLRLVFATGEQGIDLIALRKDGVEQGFWADAARPFDAPTVLSLGELQHPSTNNTAVIRAADAIGGGIDDGSRIWTLFGGASIGTEDGIPAILPAVHPTDPLNNVRSGLQAAESSFFAFGTGDFTVELILKQKARLPSRPVQSLFSTRRVGAGIYDFLWRVMGDGTSSVIGSSGSAPFQIGEWVHLAVTRSGGVGRIFLNGVQAYQGAYGTNLSSQGPAFIGCDDYDNWANFNGAIKGARITKGSALYTATFSPPSDFPKPKTLQLARTKVANVEHVGGQNLLPQGVSVIRDLDCVKREDTEFGGRGCIYGVVELYRQGGNIPLPRRVRLHRSRDALLVRETWSDAQGNYRFDGITDRYKYDVIAWDHEGLQQSVVANDLTPEVMP